MSNPIPQLIDFDGVLKVDNKPAENIEQFITFLNDRNIPAIILSNSTRMRGDTINNFFAENGIENSPIAITPVDIALSIVEAKYSRVKIYCVEEVNRIFSNYDNHNPEAVIIGDLGGAWTFEIMNEIFSHVRNGAEIIALQKNKFWKSESGELQLDAGAFISAIEFAKDKKATLIGKPSNNFFKTALKQIGFSLRDRFIMIGDDIYTDIAPAQSLGGKGILIYTGKTSFPLTATKIKPDFEAHNLVDVIEILNQLFYNI